MTYKVSLSPGKVEAVVAISDPHEMDELISALNALKRMLSPHPDPVTQDPDLQKSDVGQDR